MKKVPLGEVKPSCVPSLNPEDFELWSIPAFDSGQPEWLVGSEIGSAKKCVEPEDVLLSRIVPHIRRSWVVGPKYGARQIASGEWIIFRGSRFFPPYLRHVLISNDFHACFMQTVAGVGASLLRARPEGVKEIEIPLPSLPEQKRIAAILDQADSLRCLRKRAIDRLNSLGQAIFSEMFGDPATNQRNWPIGRIDDLTASTQYGTSGKAGDAGAFPILRMGNIKESGAFDYSRLKYIDLLAPDVEKYTVRDGDILFNRTNSPDLVGKTGVYRGDKEYAFAGYLVRLRTNDQAVPEYIGTYLNSPVGKKTLRGMCKAIIGMANINAKELRTIPIPLVPIDLL
ncbi:restriction endonuclease subunit S [Lamprocystis purpurea]|jgi:type I restriction enzyme S subunit|uniref:restriction endonuclease subunit S n=1 Tax=Lamprocystis purpurea TaxID=61598 RepID=UPI00039CFBB3|nr:restriction endonuclease subunit S [Lamprocystis purpurea]